MEAIHYNTSVVRQRLLQQRRNSEPQPALHSEQLPPMRAKSLSQGRDSPPSDSSSPGQSTISTTGESSSSLKGKGFDESLVPSRTKRRTRSTKKKKKHIIRIVSKVPDNAKSLQELDEIVGSGTVSLPTGLQGYTKQPMANHLSEDEYYYDDDEVLDSEPQSTAVLSVTQPKQEMIGNLEEVKVVQHLMRPPPVNNDMQSVWSSRSRSSSKSLRRKRGVSLEREISRTILQTAIAGEAGAAHFLVEGDTLAAQGKRALAACSAQFILTDLFYEAARQKMDDALPDPSVASEVASWSSVKYVTPNRDIPFLDDDMDNHGMVLSTRDLDSPGDEDDDFMSSRPSPYRSTPLDTLPHSSSQNATSIAVYSKPIDDEEPEEDIVSCGGIDVTAPISHMLTPPRVTALEFERSILAVQNNALMHPSQQSFLDALVCLVSNHPPEASGVDVNLKKPNSAPLKHGSSATGGMDHANTSLGLPHDIGHGDQNDEQRDKVESWFDFNAVNLATNNRLTGSSQGEANQYLFVSDNHKAEVIMATNKDRQVAVAAQSSNLSSREDVTKKVINSRRTSLVDVSSSTENPTSDWSPDDGRGGRPRPTKTDSGVSEDSTGAKERQDNLFDELDIVAASSWVKFDKQLLKVHNLETANSDDQAVQGEGKNLEVNGEKLNKNTKTSRGSTGWTPEERALYSHPTVEVPFRDGQSEEMDSSKVANISNDGNSGSNQGKVRTDILSIDSDTDDCSIWTSFDNIPSSIISNPFRDTTVSLSSGKVKVPPSTKQVKAFIPPPPQRSRSRGLRRKSRETEGPENCKPSQNGNDIASPSHAGNANSSPVHYSPASVFDLDLATKRALAKGLKLQPATASGSTTSTRRPPSPNETEASF